MMAMSLVGTSAAPAVATLSLACASASRRLPVGSLVVARATASCSPFLRTSFVAAPSSFSLSSSFSGMSLGIGFSFDKVVPQKRRGLVIRAAKAALGQTKRNRSRKSLARTHGFRRRMRTTAGRAVLKRRRAKGRWLLCPKSYPRTGKGS